jgi:hypothetical protein
VSCLSLKDLFFLLIMTLNLSKSVKFALLALIANFLASAVASHFPYKSYALACLLHKNNHICFGNNYAKVPDLLPFKMLGTLRPVGVSLLRG